MSMTRFLTTAAALALMSGVALAQSATPAAPSAAWAADTAQASPPITAPMEPAPTDPVMTDPALPDTAVAPSAATAAVDTSAAIPVSSLPPEAQAGLKAGDPNVTSNPPVADTPENRARYGKPMSNAGRRSAARGN